MISEINYLDVLDIKCVCNLLFSISSKFLFAIAYKVFQREDLLALVNCSRDYCSSGD